MGPQKLSNVLKCQVLPVVIFCISLFKKIQFNGLILLSCLAPDTVMNS